MSMVTGSASTTSCADGEATPVARLGDLDRTFMKIPIRWRAVVGVQVGDAASGTFGMSHLKRIERARTVDIQPEHLVFDFENRFVFTAIGMALGTFAFVGFTKSTGCGIPNESPPRREVEAGWWFCCVRCRSRPRSVRQSQATVRCRRDRTPAAPIARAARPPRPGTALLPAAWSCPAMMPWPATSL